MRSWLEQPENNVAEFARQELLQFFQSLVLADSSSTLDSRYHAEIIDTEIIDTDMIDTDMIDTDMIET